MTGAPTEATVLDTSALSNFAHVDRLDLLADLPRIVTVIAVERELESGVETHPYLGTALVAFDVTIPVSAPSPEAARIVTELRDSLDPGEAQGLAVADARNGGSSPTTSTSTPEPSAGSSPAVSLSRRTATRRATTASPTTRSSSTGSIVKSENVRCWSRYRRRVYALVDYSVKIIIETQDDIDTVSICQRDRRRIRETQAAVVESFERVDSVLEE